ncbi:(4Fe-4S)-binding protein [Salibacteraceae bacterium]|nr:(4Fe-4S)-binding protein [Salibacteraceae bacterium]
MLLDSESRLLSLYELKHGNMPEKERIIEYKKDEELTVIWKPDTCIHSANCVKGLAHVFKPSERRWIQTENASTEELMNTIDTCPSGALSYKVKGHASESLEIKNQDVMDLEVLKDGPLKISGEVKVKHSDGREEVREKATFLCRCGQSSNKPYCDGAHSKTGFKE